MHTTPSALRTFVLGLTFVVVACSDGSTEFATAPEAVPAELGDGWAVASMSEHGIDVEAMEELGSRIAFGEFRHVHGLVVARNGRLVYERYFNEHQRDSLHTLQSVTKSFGATLVGIAIDRGLLRTDQTLPELLPAYADAFERDPAKSEITLADLLAMRAGLEWDEWTCDYRDPMCNDNRRMNDSADWIAYVLDRPVAETPGTRFVYNSGASNLLAAILEEVVGEAVLPWAEDVLFDPMEIATYGWYRNGDGPEALPHFGGGLRLRTRDLAKLGQLYLDGGIWNGRRLLSAEQVRENTTVRSQVGARDFYGRQWWLKPLEDRADHVPRADDIRYGWGFGGQHVFYLPTLDLVVAVNAWNGNGETAAFDLLSELLRAVD